MNLQKQCFVSFSFCILNPFLEAELKKYGEDINVTAYSYFLQGVNWDERMLNIDYDNVTVSLKDTLEWTMIQLHNHTTYIFDNINGTSLPPDWNPPKVYVSFRSALRKCFSFDIPFMEGDLVWGLYMGIRNTMFPKGIRPVYSYFDGSNPGDGAGFLSIFIILDSGLHHITP